MLEKVISGGQTGVDLAALDVALELGLACGGWCPRGRLNEQGRIDTRYPLTETDSPRPAQRTEYNVRDADGTLIIARGPLTGGTALTREIAGKLGKPCLVIDPDRRWAARAVTVWLADQRLCRLNVAGPRESGSPGIYEAALRLLREVLDRK